MTERIHNITRAICRQADGPRADGKKRVASDADRLAARLFLTDYCEALSNATIVISNFHRNEVISIESKERLVIEYPTRFDKNRTPIQNEINVLLYKKHESLLPLDLSLLITKAKV